MSQGVRILTLILAILLLVAAPLGAQVSLANSALFDAPATAATTDANGLTYVASGSSLYVFAANGSVLSTRSFPGFIFTAVAVDIAGNIYGGGNYACGGGSCVTPTTVFTSGIATTNASGPAALKIDSSGNLVYLDVFVAASPNDGVVTAIAADVAGDAYLVGTTPCGWPTTAGTVHPACGVGQRLGVISKLVPNGSSAIYSTYLDSPVGGSTPTGVTTDTSGNAYVTGNAASGYPTTVGAFGAGSVASANGFVSKLNSLGTAFLYSALIPNGPGSAIALDAGGNAYIAGTSTGSLPVTAGVVGATFAPDGAGSVANYAAKLNSSGSTLTYATYLGIAQQTAGAGVVLQSTRVAIAVDAAGDAFIGGTTTHRNGPTANAVQTQLGDGATTAGFLSGDGYVVELNPTASAYLVSTYLGGRDGDSVNGLGVGPDGSIYAAGATYLNEFPLIQQISGGPIGASGFLAKITPAASAVPVLFPSDRTTFGTTVNVGDLAFGTANSGQTISKLFHLGNYGTSSLTIGAINTTGDFSQTSNCPATLAAGAGCDITVTFRPTLSGNRSGTLTIVSNGTGGFTTDHLSATAISPTVSLSSRTLGFGVVSVGSTSSAQTVTLTNTGSTPLTVASITVTGEYAQTNTCTAPVQPQASCVISVTFTPTTTGERDGTVTITDNAFDSPQTISLIGGVTADFALAVASNSSSTFGLTAGATATYLLTATPSGGFSGTVAFTCSGAPSNATCAVSPASVSLIGAGSANVTVTVTTTAHTTTASVSPRGDVRNAGFATTGWTATAMALLLLWLAPRRRRLAAVVRPLCLLLAVAGLLFIAGCGSDKKKTDNSTTGTPAGTYTLTVTGTGGSLTHSQTLTLTVQ